MIDGHTIHTEDPLPFVSFVIPTLNSARTLRPCLASIRSIDYPRDRYEIVVVDNGSRDATVQIAREFDARFVVRRLLFVGELRNQGVTLSKGEIIAFVDSDCVVPRNWLKTGLDLLYSSPTVGAVGAHYRPPANPSWIVEAWYVPHGDSSCEAHFLPAGNFIVKKDIFQRIGGFDPALIAGEDYDFCERLHAHGFQVISHRELQSIHLDDTESLAAFMRKELWYGKGMAPSLKKLANKTVVVTHLFAASAVVLSLSLLAGSAPGMLLSGAVLGGITVLSAFYRNYVKAGRRPAKYLLRLLPIYFAYYTARSVSLAWVYSRIVSGGLSRMRG